MRMIETIMKHRRQGHRATTRKWNLLSETSLLNGEVVVAIEIEVIVRVVMSKKERDFSGFSYRESHWVAARNV